MGRLIVRPMCRVIPIKLGTTFQRPDIVEVLEESAGCNPSGGSTWINFCWVCAAGLSEPLLHYSLFYGPL